MTRLPQIELILITNLKDYSFEQSKIQRVVHAKVSEALTPSTSITLCTRGSPPTPTLLSNASILVVGGRPMNTKRSSTYAWKTHMAFPLRQPVVVDEIIEKYLYFCSIFSAIHQHYADHMSGAFYQIFSNLGYWKDWTFLISIFFAMVSIISGLRI